MNPYPHLPPDIKAAFERYVLKHEELGGFCMAVLRNDLIGTINRADASNRQTDVLRDIVLYVYNELPVVAVDDPAEWLTGCGANEIRNGYPDPGCTGASDGCICHRWQPD